MSRLIEATYHVGSGGSADVYLGTYDGHKPAAFKAFKAGVPPDFIDREEELMALLPHHVTLVEFVAAGTAQVESSTLPTPEGKRRFIEMEFVPGGTLKERIGSLSPQQAIESASSLLTALSVMHDAGVVHRDIKPANVLVNPEGGVKLGDFGTALQPDSTEPDIAAGFISPAYAAPELLNGDNSPAADQFAAGFVIYEAYTEKKPFLKNAYGQFESRTPLPLGQALERELTPLDVELEEILKTALAHNPEERYDNVDKFKAKILSLIA